MTKKILQMAVFFLLGSSSLSGWAQDLPQEGLTLYESVMCEDVRDRKPFNPTVIFPISRGKAYCYTFFDPVPKKTFVYHNWYRKDVLSFTIRLQIQPPNWTTYSSIQLRESDIGPWRVEVKDADDNIFEILRFSVTE